MVGFTCISKQINNSNRYREPQKRLGVKQDFIPNMLQI
jgi:hypothetical protein